MGQSGEHFLFAKHIIHLFPIRQFYNPNGIVQQNGAKLTARMEHQSVGIPDRMATARTGLHLHRTIHANHEMFTFFETNDGGLSKTHKATITLWPIGAMMSQFGSEARTLIGRLSEHGDRGDGNVLQCMQDGCTVLWIHQVM